MSQDRSSRPASASRRLFIASGSASAVFAALGAAAVEQSRIAALIDEHRKARAVFNAAFDASDEAIRFGRESDEFRRADERHDQTFFAMEDVFLKLCAEPARSLAEARMKAVYVLEAEPDLERPIAALLNSFSFGEDGE